MLRFLVSVVIIAVLAYLGATVPLGNKTLFGHIRAIWHTGEVQDLKNGVEEKAGPAIERVKRGVHAGYNAATDDAGADAAVVKPAP
jgi:hypothetical protein